MSDLLKRTLTAIILIALLIVIIYYGGRVLEYAVLFFSLELCHELCSAFKFKGYKIPERYILLACLIHYVVFRLEWPWFISFTVPMFLLIVYYLREDSLRIEEMGICVLILVYVPSFLFPIMYLDKTYYLYLVFIVAIATDTFAYFVGNAFGKRKLCPEISPNKTVEGSLGGIIGALVCGYIYSLLFQVDVTFLHLLFIGIASVTAQLGDLFASKIKRATGIKDYGHFLPGHGGFMDRLDSMLLIIPMIYILSHFAL